MSDEFIPTPKVAKEFGVSPMTVWRWDRDPGKIALGWPPPIRMGTAKYTRTFRSRQQLERFKENLIRATLDVRKDQAA
jgi:hypothetical protein